ncbi:MAG TPA: nucleoside monophosphate kinase [Opitutales bacterium]|nr:nucleoside monophosphate kinase [Opitutales bacterium]
MSDAAQIKDAEKIMGSAWNSLEKEVGTGALVFPREIIWLNGAPGAGKGTQTRFIMEVRSIKAEPVVISDLLQSPEMKKLKDAGLMVGDAEVIGLMLRALIRCGGDSVIVDGFPRTSVQADCLKILFGRLKALHAADAKFPAPSFHIVALLVDEKTSVDRQLSRGAKAKAAGEELRKTDTDPDAARARYTTYLALTHKPLEGLKSDFPFHLVDAQKSVAEVQAGIRATLSK